MRRVAITGMGTVCPLGNDLDQALDHGLAGATGIRPADKYLWGEFGAQIPCRVAGIVEGLDESLYVPKEHIGGYDPAVTFALAASQQAIADSGLSFTEEQRDRTAVIFGSAAPGSHTYHRALHQAFVERRAHELSGRTSLNISGNMPSALVALRHGFRGPNFGIVNACAAGSTAISVAADTIRAGRADVAVTGGTESCIGLALLGSMGNAGAINPTSDPDRASRPFAMDRAGLIMAEGAGVLVLESWDDAVARGARIYGELLGESLTDDAYHVYHPDAEGETWARAISLALKTANVAPDEVDMISAHAASTPRGDLAETRAIKKVLGKAAYDVPVSATKSMHGHMYGATGAVETILALGAIRRQTVMPTTNLDRADPECDLDYVSHGARPVRSEVLLKNSFGFGGTNACLVIRAA